MRNIRRSHIFFFGVLLTTYAIASGVGKPLNTSESGKAISFTDILSPTRPPASGPLDQKLMNLRMQNLDAHLREILTDV
jgi:hypothetical protein